MLISSISKPITVAVLMKLIELDLLHLNDDVSKHVEEFPKSYIIKDNEIEDVCQYKCIYNLQIYLKLTRSLQKKIILAACYFVLLFLCIKIYLFF